MHDIDIHMRHDSVFFVFDRHDGDTSLRTYHQETDLQETAAQCLTLMIPFYIDNNNVDDTLLGYPPSVKLKLMLSYHANLNSFITVELKIQNFYLVKLNLHVYNNFRQ